MRILLTNDDGYQAAGIRALHAALKAAPEGYEVTVVAPDRDRSAVSHGITTLEPVTVKEVEPGIWSCSGTPVDCVNRALRQVCVGTPPDVVVSGINEGENLGTDIVFSGTVAAARQAVMYGIAGIAASLLPVSDFGTDCRFQALARFVARHVRALAALSSEDVLVNINARSAQAYARACYARVARRIYEERGAVRQAGLAHVFEYQGGAAHTGAVQDSDWAVVMRGDIAITLVYAQPVSMPPVLPLPDFAFQACCSY